MKELGKYLRELRGRESLRSVAENVGISHTYLDSLEKGNDPRTSQSREPSFKTLRLLAEHYDIPYVVLLAKAEYLTYEDIQDYFNWMSIP